MTNTKQYRCVNCGKSHNELYKTYGPSVLKLTKCDKCKCIVDKYIEYDPVIVMIDLVLMSKEAQRHVLYNTEFESYWKLFIILVMLETYGVWHGDSLFNIVVDSICGVTNKSENYTNFALAVPESWRDKCWAYQQENRGDNNDLFIWEKDFYIQFLATLSGILVFLVMLHSIMGIVKPKLVRNSRNQATPRRVCQAWSLGRTGALLSLPALVWAPGAAAALHHTFVFLYSLQVFTNVFSVLYECPTLVTTLTLLVCTCAKYVTSFHATPLFRGQLS
ncbi:ACAT-related protein required for viability 1 [Aphomia sociella]